MKLKKMKQNIWEMQIHEEKMIKYVRKNDQKHIIEEVDIFILVIEKIIMDMVNIIVIIFI